MSQPPREVLVAAGRLVTPDAVVESGWLRVRGTRVTEVSSGVPPRTPDADYPSGIVVPGFVDTHVHGGGGASFSTSDPEEAARAAAFHLSHGTTSLVASLVTAPTGELLQQTATLAGLVEAGTLAGIHLEGPWLSPRFRGAHDASWLRPPDAASVSALTDSARGCVRMVTLAPELEGGLDAIRQVTGSGAVAAVGHTACDYDTAKAAIDAGATVATHLFNAMPPLHHRSPGPVLALLQDPRVAVELILDGVHLHPQVAAWAMSCAAGRVVLVTDAMAAAGAPDGEYRLGGLEVLVREGVATLAESGVIAGSTLTMHAALVRAVRLGVPLAEAVRSASTRPAARLGLDGVGTLRPGSRADLVVLDEELAVRRVMARGRWQEPSRDQTRSTSALPPLA